ncbi:hypothetical protein QBC43DRAFT_319809 [Cladorrhinum sp. PSN259]|nr:hypothetical protein QBC43DRAFT_319809 [Cladorrhinum sp. PSN259]
MADSDTSTIDPVGVASMVASIASAFIAIVTLLTVYLAAMQLASQNRMYRLGLSWRAIGPWKHRVASSSYLGLRRRVYVPAVSLSSLVDNNWNPELAFPAGFPKDARKAPGSDPEGSLNVQAKASWVNFVQALGLSAESSSDKKDFYEMQDASELVNGVVPMPWSGKDLVGICSILGFQSHEEKPSHRDPMPLPMQWSGPLGWLQFRSSPNGCIVEFRRRMHPVNQIPNKIHQHWRASKMPDGKHFLCSRLWNTIGGLLLADGSVLYLGGSNRRVGPRDMDLETDKEGEPTQAKLLDDLTSADLSSEEILSKLYGRKKKDRPEALRGDANHNPTQAERFRGDQSSGRPDILESLLAGKLEKLQDSCGRKELLRPSPGLLTINIHGELAYSRGLAMDKCQEYDRKYITHDEEYDVKQFTHNIGDLYMDEPLLAKLKDALLLLRPDGFYFSPTRILVADLDEAYDHIEQQSNRLMHIFPEVSGKSPFAAEALHLHHAMALCNNLQSTRKTSNAVFSVDDMRILAMASHSLQPIISGTKPGSSSNGKDLFWAMLYSRDLSQHIRESLKPDNMAQFATAKVVCQNGVLSCASLPGLCGSDPLEEKTAQYSVPLVADGEYTGLQVMAALADVFITYYWIDKKWVTDVAVYDWTIPQSVTMC